MRISSLLTRFTVMAIAVSALLLFTGCTSDPQSFEGATEDLEANAIPGALLTETGDMGVEYLERMIFVGDSNTAHLVGFGVLPGGKSTDRVWLPKGNTITLDSEITNKTVLFPATGEYLTIPDAAAKGKPEYLVISLGTNGVATLSETQFKYCYKKLINAIRAASPETRIIVQSIYPVTAQYEGFSNSDVDRANIWLLSLAEECGVKYADTASVLKDSHGSLKEEYNSDHMDGYHINKEAAELILLYIRTHGYKE